MWKRVASYLAMGAILGALGLAFLEQPPRQTLAIPPALTSGERFSRLLEIRVRRPLNEAEERELEELKVILLDELRKHKRMMAGQSWE